MKAIGIMSGTSLDGIDVCLVDIKEIDNSYKYYIDSFGTYPYDVLTLERIKDATSILTSNVQKVCSLNFEVAHAYVKAIESFISEFNVDMSEVEFIAIHGQTIWHNPDQMDGYASSTLQVGEPSVIAYHFNKKVISNFRCMDMAAGGCGAPLIPFIDYLLYKDRGKNIALQNIGGIGNVCYIKKDATIDDVVAFDTGPGNMLIDGAMQKLFNLSYDDGGSYAFKGNVNQEVLDELMKDEYLDMPLPKSTGREKYNEEFLNNVINKVFANGGSSYDVISTLTAYTAYTIVDQYKKFLGDIDLVFISGGGCHNKYISNVILDELSKTNMQVKIVIENTADAFEAFGFAILGHMTLLNKPSNVPSVTGASRCVVLGNITNPPYEVKK